MTSNILHLSAGDIDSSPGWLVCREEPDAGFLSVIAKFGVVQPVLITERDGAWILVCGWKRVQACRSLNLSIPCLPITADDLACAEIFLHCKAEKLRSGPLALAWARYIFSRLQKQEAEKRCASSLRPLLGAKDWRCLQAWLNLDQDWDQLITQGRVPFELGPVLTTLKLSESHDFLPLFSHSNWSVNKARQMATWLIELSKRDGRSVHYILKDLGIFDILNRDLSPKDAQQAVIHQVRGARFPALTKLEQEFDRLQEEVARKTRWRIQPEQHFESNGLRLQTQIRSQADAELALADLQSIVESSDLQRIWSWQEVTLDEME
jgi:hypothetical protein